MLIVTRQNTSRLKYVSSFISRFYSTPVEVVVSLDSVPKNEIVLNYTEAEIPDSISIPNSGFLSKKGISKIDINSDSWKGYPTLFHESGEKDIPFDMLSAIFYLLSFYTEYIDNKRDKHERFTASQSIEQKLGFLDKPIIDIWLLELKKLIESKGYALPSRNYKFISTIDVDMAYAILYRGLKNQVKALGRSIKGNYLKDFLNIVLRRERDPYNCFDFIRQEHEKAAIRPIVFFQVGENGKFDKNLSIKQRKQQQIIKETMAWADIGLHPSYPSFNRPDIIHREIKSLKEVTNKKINQSRQHYLRFQIPDTFRYLSKAGVSKEYSVGFADSIGFRGGTCTPFRFYDLPIERMRSIKLYPLAAMDSTLKHYYNASPEEAFTKLKNIINEVKKVNGTFISLWHNSSFHKINNMEGWDEVFKKMINYAKP